MNRCLERRSHTVLGKLATVALASCVLFCLLLASTLLMLCLTVRRLQLLRHVVLIRYFVARRRTASECAGANGWLRLRDVRSVLHVCRQPQLPAKRECPVRGTGRGAMRDRKPVRLGWSMSSPGRVRNDPERRGQMHGERLRSTRRMRLTRTPKAAPRNAALGDHQSWLVGCASESGLARDGYTNSGVRPFVLQCERLHLAFSRAGLGSARRLLTRAVEA